MGCKPNAEYFFMFKSRVLCESTKFLGRVRSYHNEPLFCGEVHCLISSEISALI
jgi:hypothetical protein